MLPSFREKIRNYAIFYAYSSLESYICLLGYYFYPPTFINHRLHCKVIQI